MKILATTAVLAGLMMAGSASATVIFSENFNEYDPSSIAHGATGGTGALPFTVANHPAAAADATHSISTSYSYRVPGNGNTQNDPDSMWDEGTWTIATVPQDTHNLWVPTSDGSQMLLINGATTKPGNTPLTAYESGGINVHAGSFTYSYDLLNLCCASNPGLGSVLQLWYTAPTGGTSQIFINSTVTTDASGFSHIAGSFDVSQGGTIRLGLVDNSTDASGNDFGIDNIKLNQTAGVVPEPAAWALMMLGFGGIGATLRSKRRQAVAA